MKLIDKIDLESNTLKVIDIIKTRLKCVSLEQQQQQQQVSDSNSTTQTNQSNGNAMNCERLIRNLNSFINENNNNNNISSSSSSLPKNSSASNSLTGEINTNKLNLYKSLNLTLSLVDGNSAGASANAATITTAAANTNSASHSSAFQSSQSNQLQQQQQQQSVSCDLNEKLLNYILLIPFYLYVEMTLIRNEPLFKRKQNTILNMKEANNFHNFNKKSTSSNRN